MGNEKKERLRLEIPSHPRSYITPGEEDVPPPPLPARRNHAHLSGHFQSPTSPVLFPRSPRTSPRPSPRSSPLASPNLSPENSPHPSPRLPRHRHDPIEMLAENDDIPPKLPARSKPKTRSQDYLDSNFDASSHSIESDDTHGRFPYSGVDLTSNRRTVPIENSAKTTTYADLAFPKQDKDKESSRGHTPVGPRLSLNDKDIDEFDDPNSAVAFDAVDRNFANNDFCVHGDPFEGANPFLEDKSKQRKSLGVDESYPNGTKGNSLPKTANVTYSNLAHTSKSLEDLTVDSSKENGYTLPTGSNPPVLPRCFSNPTYDNNFQFIGSKKPSGLPDTIPARHSPIGGRHPIQFEEEDLQILMNQGYTRDEIKKALVIAENNFAMARKILRGYHGTRPHQDE